jgi:hypothetical protein
MNLIFSKARAIGELFQLFSTKNQKIENNGEKMLFMKAK